MTDETADHAEQSVDTPEVSMTTSLSARLRQVADAHPSADTAGALTVRDVALTVADYVDAVPREEALEDLHRLLAFRPGMTAALGALLLATCDDASGGGEAPTLDAQMPKTGQPTMGAHDVAEADQDPSGEATDGAPGVDTTAGARDDFQVTASAPGETVVWATASPDWTEAAFDDSEDVAYEEQLRQDREQEGLDGDHLDIPKAHPVAPQLGRLAAPETDQLGAVSTPAAGSGIDAGPASDEPLLGAQASATIGHRAPGHRLATGNRRSLISADDAATPDVTQHGQRFAGNPTAGRSEPWEHATVVGTPGTVAGHGGALTPGNATPPGAASPSASGADDELPGLGATPPAPTWEHPPGSARPAPRRPMRAPTRPRKMPFSTLVPAPSPDPFGEALPVRGSTATNLSVPAPATDPFASARHRSAATHGAEPTTPAWGEPALPPPAATSAGVTVTTDITDPATAGLGEPDAVGGPIAASGLVGASVPNADAVSGSSTEALPDVRAAQTGDTWSDLDLDSLGDLVTTTGAGAVETSSELHSNATPSPPDWLVRASSVGATPTWADDSSPASELYDAVPPVVTEVAAGGETNPGVLPAGVTTPHTLADSGAVQVVRRASGGSGVPATADPYAAALDVAPDTGEVPVVQPAGQKPDVLPTHPGAQVGQPMSGGNGSVGQGAGGQGSVRLPNDAALTGPSTRRQ